MAGQSETKKWQWVQKWETTASNRVCLVRLGATVVRTKRSGALLKCALGCALLAHFASKVRSLQAKCALKIGVPRPSAHLKAPQTDLRLAPFPSAQVGCKTQHFCPTCALRFLRWNHIVLVISVVLFIASYCWTQTCFASKQYYSFQINLIFSPLAGTGRESIVLETVVSQRD
jgi:hypothetical protein